MSGSASIIPYMGIIGILLITMKLGPADAVIGYDCDTELQKKFKFLEDINYCDLFVEDVKVSSESIAVLQINEYKQATILQCKIEIQRVINKCGFKSSNPLGNNTVKEYIFPISRKACEIAIDHGTITIGKTTINDLRMNDYTPHNVTFAGSIDSTTGCTGGNYSDPYGTWNNVVVTGTAKITLQSHVIKVDVNSDSIELPSGYECKFSKGECIDFDGGYTFRDILPLKFCSDKTYSVLYNGTATKLKSEDGRMYAIKIKDTRFTFNTIGNESSCGATLYKTDSPELYVVESEDLKHLERFKIVGNHTDNSDVSHYENDKMIYAEKFTKYRIEYLFSNVIENKCDRLNDIMRIARRTASEKPDQFAFEVMGGPGYTAVMKRDKFHIVQCVPVEVKLQQPDKCYNRLPILKGNQKMFLTPRTHIITNNSTYLCNGHTPERYCTSARP